MAQPKLAAKRIQAAELLAEGRTQKEVAAEVGVTDRSIRDWLGEPEFVEMVIAKARQRLHRAWPVLYRVLMKYAIEGEGWAARLLLEHMEKLEGIGERHGDEVVVVQWASELPEPTDDAD